MIFQADGRLLYVYLQSGTPVSRNNISALTRSQPDLREQESQARVNRDRERERDREELMDVDGDIGDRYPGDGYNRAQNGHGGRLYSDSIYQQRSGRYK